MEKENISFPEDILQRLKVSRSQGLKVSRSQGLKVSRSQGLKVPGSSMSQALKPFYSSQNPVNLSLTLKQLLLVYILINLCSYGPEDINLSDGLVVEQTFITSSGVPNNNLITFLQDHSARMASASRISYRRMNHKDFAFNIRIRNPNGSSKKVIVRIFLTHQRTTNVNGIDW